MTTVLNVTVASDRVSRFGTDGMHQQVVRKRIKREEKTEGGSSMRQQKQEMSQGKTVQGMSQASHHSRRTLDESTLS